MPSYSNKQLRVTFILAGAGSFVGSDSANKLVLTGLRMTSKISCQGAPAWPHADFAVYGMAASDMKTLTSVTFNTNTLTKNTITLEANVGDGWTTVYAGDIVEAHIEYGSPDVCLRVSAQVGFFDQLNSANVTSYTGSVPAATVISNICAKLGWTFQNNGVTAVLNNTYLAGTLITQLATATAHAGVDGYSEGGGAAGPTVYTICPKGAARNTPSFALSPANGLVGYPTVISLVQINVRALYNPAFRWGGPLTIQGSDVVIDPTAPKNLNTQADGNWMIGQMTHSLDALKFDGAWFTDMLLYPPGTSPPQQ